MSAPQPSTRTYAPELVEKLLTALQEFGYPTLKRDEIITALDCFYDGRKAGNVIEVMVHDILCDAGANPGDIP